MLIVAGLAVGLLIFLIVNMGRDEEPLPDPSDNEEENGDEQEDWAQFAGRVWFNQEEIELDNTPLVAKGLVYLPLLEIAERMDIEADYDEEQNRIEIGEPAGEEAAGDENVKIYRDGVDFTPSDLIRKGDEFYVDGKELGNLLGLYTYENQFANGVWLFDDELPLNDGAYVAVSKRDQRGWAPEIRITIAGGQVADVAYFEFDEEDVNKFEDEQYLGNWQDSYPDVDPPALIQQLEQQLVERQEPADVDVASGATGSYGNFVRLASVVFAQARAEALPAQFAAGEYVVLGDPSQQGWTPKVEFTVADGALEQLFYDEIDEAGESKRDNTQYMEGWKNAYPEVDPVAIIDERQLQVIRTQDPNTVDATTGATAWGVNMKQLTLGALDHAFGAELGTVVYDTILVVVGERGERGDLPQLLLALQEGEIMLVDFSDYRDGVAKKFDRRYLQQWQEQYPDVEPLDILAEMEAQFLETGDPDSLEDVTSGATGWQDSFQELAARALEYLNGGD